MTQLPSYQDAVSQSDWLEVAAGHVDVADLARLCAVNKRFHRIFAPRLWNDPLNTVRSLGLDPSNDLDWYFKFISSCAQHVRGEVSALVTTLDFRNFAKATTHFWTGRLPQTIPDTFKNFPSLFPNLRCLLLDGHTEAEPATLAAASSQQSRRLLMLSIPDCDTSLPANFFTSDYVSSLVYLDVSKLQGSLQPLFEPMAPGGSLSQLKVLKLAGRELHDEDVTALCMAFKSRLWSLDISGNKLTDAVIDALSHYCFSSPLLRSNGHFRKEGRVEYWMGQGNPFFGPFTMIRESDHSAKFDHPERHFADTPVYSANSSLAMLQENEAVRAAGRAPLTHDNADYFKGKVSGDATHMIPPASDVPHLDVCCAPQGITHINLTGNYLTSLGIDRLVRLTNGQIEDLACDAPILQLAIQEWPTAWPKDTRLRGFLGYSHVFRPVYSSNLRALRIHHSLVTQIPTLETDNLSTMARLWIAETSIRKRSEMAYPQAFEPDMNPRLASLTLTQVPRRSVGPLADKLTRLLRLAAIQEQAIDNVSSSASSRRSPAMLRGLRHIRLEFEADPIDDPAGWSNSDDLDAEDLLNMDDGEGFSFFEDEHKSRSQPNSQRKPELPTRPMAAAGGTPASSDAFPRQDRSSETDPTGTRTGVAPNARGETSARLEGTLDASPRGQHVQSPPLTWRNHQFTAKVWVGDGGKGAQTSHNEAVRAYIETLEREPGTARWDTVGPASPAHVKAGVPEGELIFYSAWDSMLMPTTVNKPGRSDLHAMKDVVESLRAFRLAEKAKRSAGGRHHFWTGTLEVATQQSTAHYQSSRYWR